MDQPTQFYTKGDHTPKVSKKSDDNSPMFQLLKLCVVSLVPTWMCSKDDLIARLQLAVDEMKERPISSTFYGLVLIFGFIPFLGFILLVGGSFAFLFTGFLFFQVAAVLTSAMFCAGLFWCMLGTFVMLSLMLGGTVHTLNIWREVSRHIASICRGLSISLLKRAGISENGTPLLHHAEE